jgi:hypothetical protein
MTERTHLHGAVDSPSDLQDVFRDLRHDVDTAHSRAGLTELYQRAGYLITLTHTPAWEKKFGSGVPALRRTAEAEFAATARRINRRAEDLGTEPNYDEQWG